MADITLTVKKLAEQLASEMRSAYDSESNFLRLAHDTAESSVDADAQVKGWYLQQINDDYRVVHGSSQPAGLLLAFIDASAAAGNSANFFAPMLDAAQSNESIERAAKFAVFSRIADLRG